MDENEIPVVPFLVIFINLVAVLILSILIIINVILYIA